MAEANLDESHIRKHMRAEGNAALTKGGLIAAALGFFGGLFPLTGMLIGVVENLEVPILTAFIAAAMSLVIWALARRNRIEGPLLYAIFLPFVSLPTIFNLLCHFLLPAGTATYITGPFSYLYFFLIVMTGFLFRPGLSITAGFVAAVGYMLSYHLGREQILTIQSADPTLTQDLTSAPIYAVKSVMMIFAGFGVAAISLIAKRLILRVLTEERHKTTISRLFGQFVSDEVKDKIIAEKAELVGEKKEVVVLFSDIRSFSTYSENLAPEQVVRDLNEYFEAMVQAITREGGVVDKFIGDAIMAVFGGVLDLDDPVAASVRAARGMRSNLKQLNAEWQAHGIPPFDNGIGMHFGEVLQGPLGSAERKEFTVIGDTVNTAARLEGQTKNYDECILITEAMHEQLPDELKAACTHHGEIKVKGKAEQVSIYGVGDP